MKTTKKATIGRRRVGETCTFCFFRQRAIILFAVLAVLAGLSLTSAVAGTVQNLFVTVLSGTNGIIYMYPPNGTKSTFASGLNQPYGLVCDNSGNVYVSVWGIGGSGQGSIFEYNSNGVQSTYASGLTQPACMAFDSSGDLYVADYGDGTIYKISGGTKNTFATGLDAPTGVACDSAGNLYVATSFGTIYKFSPAGGRSTFATISNESESNRYFRMAFDNAGDLFVSDEGNDAIFKFANNNGTLSSSYTTFGAGLDLPIGVAFDNAGDLFEADSGSGKIQTFVNVTGQLSSNPTTFVPAPGTMFDLAFQPELCGGPATVQNIFVALRSGTIRMYTPNGTRSTFATGLSEPFGIVSDNAGDLYVSTWGNGASGNGDIYKYTPAGVQTTFASGLDEPAFMAFDVWGDLFESDYGDATIYEFPVGGAKTAFATGLYFPSGIAVNGLGDVYVADGEGNIYEFTPTGSKSTFATGLTTSDETASYISLSFDSAGDLFAADYLSGEIYEFQNSGGTLNSTPVDFSAAGIPMGLAFDNSGDLFEGNELDVGSILEYTNYNGSLDPHGVIWVTDVGNRAQDVYDVAVQSLGPVSYGYGAFLAYDSSFPPYPAVPFYGGVAYSISNDTIYATAGTNDNPGSIYDGDAFTYGIPSNLNYDPVYSDVLDSPGDYTDDGFFDSPAPTPAVGNNGTTYVVTPSGVLYALNPGGSAKWIYYGIGLDGGEIYASPTIGLDGNIYVATDDGNEIFTVFCIDPDLGLPKWELNVGSSGFGDVDASPLCTTNGIYDLDENGYVHFMTYDGQEYSPLQIGPNLPYFPSSSPAIDAQGLLWVGTGPVNGYPTLAEINPVTQQIVQQVELNANSIDSGAYVSASPVIGPDGNIYVGTSVGDFYAVSDSSQAAIVAETSLGTDIYPTTAAVGSDSRVYVGTSYCDNGYNNFNGSPDFNPTNIGSFYSLQLKPVCGQTYPDEFVIDWQYTNTDGGFFGAPIVASVGSNHSTNVIYAPNADGNIYAFLASAGPSTNTWSTFKGNDQRQDNWGRQSIPRPELWNVQFGSPSSTLDQTGKAAYGNTTNDYWNAGIVQNNSGPTYTVYDYTNGESSPSPSLTVTASCNSGVYGANVPSGYDPFNDNLMAHYMYSENAANAITITISGLPTQALNNGLNNGQAQYDVYVYAYGGKQGSTYYNSEIQISPEGTDPVNPYIYFFGASPQSEPQKTTCQELLDGTIEAAPPTDLDYFTQNYDNEEVGQTGFGYENGEYVVFHNVQVTSTSGVITITIAADPNNSNSFPLINGIQIVAKQ